MKVMIIWTGFIKAALSMTLYYYLMSLQNTPSKHFNVSIPRAVLLAVPFSKLGVYFGFLADLIAQVYCTMYISCHPLIVVIYGL